MKPDTAALGAPLDRPAGRSSGNIATEITEMSIAGTPGVWIAGAFEDPAKLAAAIGARGHAEDEVRLVDIIEAYLEETAWRYKPGTMTTRAKALSVLRAHAAKLLGSPAHTITPAVAQAAYDRIHESAGVHQASKASKLCAGAWKHALQTEMVRRGNPFATIRRAKAKRPQIYFGPGWLPTMLSITEQARDERIVSARSCDFFLLAMGTAARPVELRNLKWANVDVGGAIIFEISKVRERTIPIAMLPATSRRALERQRGRSSTWVFPGALDPKSATSPSISGEWPQLRDYARAKGQRMDTLGGRPLTLYQASRHALATWMLGELGLEPHVVSQFLGHDDLASLAHYTHLSVHHLRDAAERVAKALEGGDSMPTEDEGLAPSRLARAVEAMTDVQKQGLLKANGQPLTAQALRSWGLAGKHHRDPSAANLARMSRLLGVTPNYFYGIGPADLIAGQS